MADIYQGDLKVTLGPDGSDIVIRGGQPVMDRGVETAALIGLFTRFGWVGNYFLDEAEQIGSDFEESLDQAITLQALNDIRDAGEKALGDPLFGDVVLSVLNPQSYRLDITALIDPPANDAAALTLTRNGLNWVSQANDPAYRRV